VTPAPYLVVGGLCGLAWAAALRGWMVQLAGTQSTFTWLTFLLVLLPGVAVGSLLGRAAYLRVNGVRLPRALIFAPVLFAGALLDPKIFLGLIREGTGSGALIVVATALAGGYALARRGWSVGRVAAAVLAVPGLLMLTLMGGMTGPVSSPRGAWVCLYGFALMLLLCWASALPYAEGGGVLGPVRLTLLGAVAGLAWACALRGFMAAVQGADSEVHRVDTFGFILLPGLAAGGLLGLAEHLRRTGGRPRLRLFALAPLLLLAVLLSDPLDLPSLLADGVGGGAIGVPVIGILGGYAVCGRGSPVRRAAAGLVFLAGLAVWALTATAVGGAGFALTTPHGLWATLFYYALLATLALAASVPLREPAPARAASGEPAPLIGTGR
jgi:hypothetical protein